MAWYSTGTASFTNGSKAVTGSTTSWFGALQTGWGMVGADGRVYEIETVTSATSLTLKTNYQGSTASAQAYAIFPTNSLEFDLVTSIQNLIGNFQGVVDGAGAGKFLNGTAALPSVSFVTDPDTGMFRADTNKIGWSTGGVQRMALDSSGLDLSVPIVGDAVQSNPTDGTTGRLMKVGAFGLGDASGLFGTTNLKDRNLRPGFYNYSTGDVPGGPEIASWFHSLIVTEAIDGRLSLISFRNTAPSAKVWMGSQSAAGGAITWVEIFSENNATTSKNGGTVGQLLKVGDFGIGDVNAPSIDSFETLLKPGLYRYSEAGTINAPGDGAAWAGTALVMGTILGSGRVNVLATRTNTAHPRTWIGSRSTDTGPLTWTEITTRKDIIGTVSQAAGVPTGSIFEYGTNANGKFIRYADGTQICWVSDFNLGSIMGAGTGTFDDPRRTDAPATLTWPAAFAFNPVATHTLQLSGDSVVVPGARALLLVPTNGPTTTVWSGLRAQRVSSNTTARDALLSVIAIGRWF